MHRLNYEVTMPRGQQRGARILSLSIGFFVVFVVLWGLQVVNNLLSAVCVMTYSVNLGGDRQ